MACTCFAVACPGRNHVVDAGESGATLDAGHSSGDGGSDDAGPNDAGATLLDAGSIEDAGHSDAGNTDAGNIDAGPSDAGPPIDGGPAPLCSDAGLHNGGDGVCVPLGNCSLDFYLRPDGQCTAWHQTNALPGGGLGVALIANGSDLYAVCNSEAFDARTTLVGIDVAAWQSMPDRNPETFGCAPVLIGDTFYALGGYDPMSGNILDAIVSAPLEADGSVGAWSELPSRLATARGAPGVFVDTSTLILTAGVGNGGLISSVETAQVAPDNSLGPFSLVGDMPEPFNNATTTKLDDASGTFFVMPGGLAEQFENAWVYSTTDPGLGQWTTTLGPGDLRGACIVRTGNELIGIGGTIEAIQFSATYAAVTVADIASDGTIGAWRRVGVLDTDRRYAGCIVMNDTIVVAGGLGTVDGETGDQELTSVATAKVGAVLRSVEAP
jgi:hypothetical protein